MVQKHLPKSVGVSEPHESPTATAESLKRQFSKRDTEKVLSRPLQHTAQLTAGLKWPPEISLRRKFAGRAGRDPGSGCKNVVR